MATGAHRALSDTRDRYYADYCFADLSSDVVRAPLSIADEARAIDGVVQAEPRIVKLGRPEIEAWTNLRPCCLSRCRRTTG